MTRIFRVGDKVFAKVRGYPAWPARVEKITEASSNKNKYHVFFYGTSETAVCKVEDLYNYQDYKEKYGKPLKRKGFNEALAQIEGLTPVPVVKQEVKIKEEPEDSDVEGNLIIDENPKQNDGKKKAVKRKRESGSDYVDGKSSIGGGGGSSGGGGGGNSTGSYKRTPVPPQKRFKKVSPSPRETTNTPGNLGPLDCKFINGSPVSTNKPEIVSRSGRKIKPKKFADEEAFDRITLSTEGEAAQKVNGEPITNKRRQSCGHSGSNLAESTKKNNRTHVRNTPVLNDPVPGCSSMPSERYNGEGGSVMLPDDDRPLSKMDRLIWFRNEARMLEIETMIRGNLSIKKANTTQSINLLKQLCDLDVKPLMLKKHPQVVKTIKKVRRYIGNPEAWNLTEDQKLKFSDDAHQIRAISHNDHDRLHNDHDGAYNDHDRAHNDQDDG